MLLLMTGASGAGKSTALPTVRRELAGLPVTIEEFDSIGVPSHADTAWRQAATEQWVQRAHSDQRSGRHLLLCGQVPVGEALAAPSATRLDGVAACLLHCSPATRRARLASRGITSAELAAHVAFGIWFAEHMKDSTHRPEVIREHAAPDMHWDRWSGWSKGDPRWAFEVIATDALTPQQVGEAVAAWSLHELPI